MAKRQYFYVENMGGVWKLSKTQYIRLLNNMKNSEPFDLDNYGEHLTVQLMKADDLQDDPAQYLADLKEG